MHIHCSVIVFADAVFVFVVTQCWVALLKDDMLCRQPSQFQGTALGHVLGLYKALVVVGMAKEQSVARPGHSISIYAFLLYRKHTW